VHAHTQLYSSASFFSTISQGHLYQYIFLIMPAAARTAKPSRHSNLLALPFLAPGAISGRRLQLATCKGLAGSEKDCRTRSKGFKAAAAHGD
jgi:hypothetical protein